MARRVVRRFAGGVLVQHVRERAVMKHLGQHVKRTLVRTVRERRGVHSSTNNEEQRVETSNHCGKERTHSG